MAYHLNFYTQLAKTYKTTKRVHVITHKRVKSKLNVDSFTHVINN